MGNKQTIEQITREDILTLPKDIENIIIGYVFELQYEYRVEEHRKTFIHTLAMFNNTTKQHTILNKYDEYTFMDDSKYWRPNKYIWKDCKGIENPTYSDRVESMFSSNTFFNENGDYVNLQDIYVFIRNIRKITL